MQHFIPRMIAETPPNGYCHFFLFSDTACAVEITTQDNLDGVCEDVSGIQSFRLQQYDNTTLKVAGNAVRVSPKLPVIAAVAYSDLKTCADHGHGKDEVRLYYVEPDTYLVKEIRRSGPPSNDTWEFGKEFNSKGYDFDEKSGLSANVVRVGDQHQLKVYFQKHPDELSVAYRVLEAPHED
ncbi:unnamed protein product [Clonostachys chloroleuca]|uniref:Uncharacterized protein n=1 Tax=Clonostachys chloroleuca TaxID=1926264 RepID=A0AA35LWR3_9HYPO|nr:unnamed protein product [Clonostachys chloroleuca]